MEAPRGEPNLSPNLNRKTADVVLTVTDVRPSGQVAMTEGHASKTDLGSQLGGLPANAA